MRLPCWGDLGRGILEADAVVASAEAVAQVDAAAADLQLPGATAGESDLTVGIAPEVGVVLVLDQMGGVVKAVAVGGSDEDAALFIRVDDAVGTVADLVEVGVEAGTTHQDVLTQATHEDVDAPQTDQQVGLRAAGEAVGVAGAEHEGGLGAGGGDQAGAGEVPVEEPGQFLLDERLFGFRQGGQPGLEVEVVTLDVAQAVGNVAAVEVDAAADPGVKLLLGVGGDIQIGRAHV